MRVHELLPAGFNVRGWPVLRHRYPVSEVTQNAKTVMPIFKATGYGLNANMAGKGNLEVRYSSPNYGI